jgi:cell division transport system permease protein
LPPQAKTDRPLLFVVAIIVALACASAIAARAAWSAADAWTAQLDGAMTVEVRPLGDGFAEDAAADAALALADVPGVARATALSRAEVEALLAPWLGDGGVPADAPLPGLVDVRVERLAPATPNDLLAALDGLGLDAEVDDHEQWAAQIRRSAGAARNLAFAAFLALGCAAAGVIMFATRANLVARADVVEVLHLVGARDEFIAGEFTKRFMALGLRAGFAGAALAAAAGVAAVLLTQGGPADFAPRFRFALPDAIILGLTPFASAIIAAWTARETVRSALARLY